VATQYALAQGLNINMSAGAGQFKQHRGAVPYMEYSAVYVRHLPKAQQWAVHAARLLSQYIAAPMMQSLDM
jgi:predicted N-acyltransferase